MSSTSIDAEALSALRDECARTVMGWHCLDISWAYDQRTDLWHEDETPQLTRHAWRPDEDDRQCMRVVDRMTALGFECHLLIGTEETHAKFQRDTQNLGESRHSDRRVALIQAAIATLNS